MVRFSEWMVSEVVQTFWAAMARGEFITDAAAEAGTYRKKGARWLRDAGGVRPRRGRDLKGRCLTFKEREDIALGRAAGESMRAIAARLAHEGAAVVAVDRDASTLEATTKALRGGGADMHGLVADVGDPAAITTAVTAEETARHLGHDR